MKKIRYYKLHHMLRERHMTLEGLRAKTRILPSDIIKIETERMLSPVVLSLICRFLKCDACDVFDIFDEEQDGPFYSKRILEQYSYTPKTYVKKEFDAEM